jgi:cell volume regulation protein A
VAFVVVVVSLLVQGWTLARAPPWLGVAVPPAHTHTPRKHHDRPRPLENHNIG